MYPADSIRDNEKICANFGSLLRGISSKYSCVCMNGNYIFATSFAARKVSRKRAMIKYSKITLPLGHCHLIRFDTRIL